jgi:hypothetical protein
MGYYIYHDRVKNVFFLDHCSKALHYSTFFSIDVDNKSNTRFWRMYKGRTLHDSLFEDNKVNIAGQSEHDDWYSIKILGIPKLITIAVNAVQGFGSNYSYTSSSGYDIADFFKSEKDLESYLINYEKLLNVLNHFIPNPVRSSILVTSISINQPKAAELYNIGSPTSYKVPTGDNKPSYSADFRTSSGEHTYAQLMNLLCPQLTFDHYTQLNMPEVNL